MYDHVVIKIGIRSNFSQLAIGIGLLFKAVPMGNDFKYSVKALINRKQRQKENQNQKGMANFAFHSALRIRR
jgi:hypothetical protein